MRFLLISILAAVLCSCASVPRINEPFGIDVMPTVSQLRAIARHTYWNIRPRSWAPNHVRDRMAPDTQFRVLLDGGYGSCSAWAATNHEIVLRTWPGMVGSVWVYIAIAKPGSFHAVAVVEVDGMRYVMDNLTMELRKIQDVNYKWISLSLDREGWWHFSYED